MTTWTTNQVLALAPDGSSAKSAQGLAKAAKWVTLGHNPRALWGELKGSGKNPYQTRIDLPEPAFQCSCPSRKFPCKHALGLLLLFAAQPAAVRQADPPAWVEEWLRKRDQNVQPKQTQTVADDDPAQQAKKAAAKAKRTAQRQAKVEAGVAELERWLRDLIRQGLASVQTQPVHYWESIAARMVDAQAPGLARWLREMSSIPASGEGWAERLLAQLGKLHLLLEGFKRLDDLPEPVQADIRGAIGWTYKETELPSDGSLHDHWLVVGQYSYEEERLRVQRSWLRGQNSGQTALVLDFAYQGQPLNVTLVPGMNLDAELCFYPSNYPLRALVKQRSDSSGTVNGPVGYGSIAEFLSSYADALARQPWLDTFPLTLEAAIPIGNATLRDNAGQWLPLAPSADRWRLLAVSGGHPLTVFGEWNGRFLLPLSAWFENSFVTL